MADNKHFLKFLNYDDDPTDFMNKYINSDKDIDQKEKTKIRFSPINYDEKFLVKVQFGVSVFQIVSAMQEKGWDCSGINEENKHIRFEYDYTGEVLEFPSWESVIDFITDDLSENSYKVNETLFDFDDAKVIK